MGELIHYHLKAMESEIQEMQRIKLFTVEETRILIKNRKEFEYKINGVAKHLQDFKDYIIYEKVILKDLKVRRNKFKIEEKKNVIELSILNRIKYLYDIALQQFPHEFQLSLSYFNFCKGSIFPEAASDVIENMMKNFSNQENIWEIAADWFLQKNSNEALAVIRRGLAIHKNSRILCSKAIEIEMKNASQDIDAQHLCNKRIETILDSVMEEITDYKYLLEILKSVTQYEFTLCIQKLIINWLLEKHKDEELVWHTIAEREFSGHHLDQLNVPTSLNYRLEKCIDMYEKGLIEICEGHKSSLWFLYLDFLIDHQFGEDKSVSINTEQIITTFMRANQSILLSDKYFIIWAQLLEDQTKAIEIIDKGLTAVPTSLELWKSRLNYFVMKDEGEKINEVINEGFAKLNVKSLPLWLMALRYHTLNSTDELIEEMYEHGVKKPKEISDVLKPDYIEWLAVTKGTEFTRMKYASLAMMLPHCKELHVVMAKIESLECEPDINNWEKVLLLATEQFNDQLDIWKMLVELYLKYQKEFKIKRPDFDLNTKLDEVYNCAETFMKDNELLVANWKAEFDELKDTIESNPELRVNYN